MPFAASLPAALSSHAAARPAEPWFFVPAGWDWAWAPWGEVAGQVESWAARLSALPPGTRLGFADRPWPRALVIDLAAQAAGLTSVPVPLAAVREPEVPEADLLARLGCQAWAGAGDEVVTLGTGAGGEGVPLGTRAGEEQDPQLSQPYGLSSRAGARDLGGGEAATPPDPSLAWPGQALPLGMTRNAGSLSRTSRGLWEGADRRDSPRGDGSAGRPAGAVLVSAPEGPVEMSQTDLLAASLQLQDLLASNEARVDRPGKERWAWAGRRPRREILVCGGSLSDAADRRLLSWALFSGAALVLEADPAATVATVAWARPTLFQGGNGELAALRRAVEGRQGRWQRSRRRLPFGRLHTLLSAGPEELPDADLAFWEERGVRVVRMV